RPVRGPAPPVRELSQSERRDAGAALGGTLLRPPRRGAGGRGVTVHAPRLPVRAGVGLCARRENRSGRQAAADGAPLRALVHLRKTFLTTLAADYWGIHSTKPLPPLLKRSVCSVTC